MIFVTAELGRDEAIGEGDLIYKDLAIFNSYGISLFRHDSFDERFVRGPWGLEHDDVHRLGGVEELVDSFIDDEAVLVL